MTFSKVCLIITVDGFMVDGRFNTRELSYDLPGKQISASSISFCCDFPTQRAEEIQAEFLFRNLHGLPVAGGVMAQTMVPFVLSDLYETHKSKKRPLVAIKGNQHAQALLTGLQIPFIDLEKQGCPRFELLPLVQGSTCGQHKFEKRCGREQVRAYRQWMSMPF